MSNIYRYRCVFDMRFSSIPYGDWIYCNHRKYLEIKKYIEEGKKYQLQNFTLTQQHGEF